MLENEPFKGEEQPVQPSLGAAQPVEIRQGRAGVLRSFTCPSRTRSSGNHRRRASAGRTQGQRTRKDLVQGLVPLSAASMAS